MNYEQEFLKDFSEWIDQQVNVMETSVKLAEQLSNEDENAKIAAIRYESRLDAYQFLQGKFENYKNGKDFHDVGDLGQKQY